MTDRELLQAARECIECPACKRCKWTLGKEGCVVNELDTVNLINRLETLLAESERLNIELQAMQNAANGFKKMVPTWVSVEERLPENDDLVLACYGFEQNTDGRIGMRFVGPLTYFFFDPEPHWQHESCGLRVTHWMPLPEAPELPEVER